MKGESHIKQMFTGTFPQILAALCATISATSDGMGYGWSSPMVPVFLQESSPVKTTESDVVWLESTYLLGGITGLPITIFLVHRIGQKRSTLLASCCSLTSWILIASARTLEQVLVARFIIGMAGDMAFVSTPMYIAEIADRKIRGFLSSLIYLMMLMGILVIYSIGPYVPVYASSLVGACFVSLQLLTFPFMPDSPYYLLSRGKTEKAHRALARLRQGVDVQKEINEIAQAVERQKSESGHIKDLILVRSNRKAIVIMSVINAAQHFAGISVILMNMHTILESAGSIYIDDKYAAMLFALLMLLAATFGSFFVDKVGRKCLLIFSSLLTGLSLLVLSIYFNLQWTGHNVQKISWIPIVSVMVYAVVFKVGLGIVPIVMTAELFPSKIKAIGMTIADALYVLFALVSVYFYTYLSKECGIHAPMYFFAGCAILTALFTAVYIPETKGKSLEEIQMILKGVHGKNSPASVPPSTFNGNHDQQQTSDKYIKRDIETEI